MRVPDAIVCSWSALEYWRNQPFGEALGQRLGAREFASHRVCLPDLMGIDFASVGIASGPVCLMVSQAGLRSRARDFRFLAFEHPLPADSLVSVSSRIAVAAPELVFLQLAGELDVVRLALLGYELCGTYAMPADGQGGYRVRSGALTSVERIGELLDQVPDRVHGLENARRALGLVADAAASPMEPRPAIILCAPLSMGGFGLPLPRMNVALDLDAHGVLVSGRKALIPDLYWADAKVCLEYNGEDYHVGFDRIARDASKQDVLLGMGIKTFVLTKAQLYDINQFDIIAYDLARQLGVRIRPRSSQFFAKHGRLHRAVLDGEVADPR